MTRWGGRGEGGRKPKNKKKSEKKIKKGIKLSVPLPHSAVHAGGYSGEERHWRDSLLEEAKTVGTRGMEAL